MFCILTFCKNQNINIPILSQFQFHLKFLQSKQKDIWRISQGLVSFFSLNRRLVFLPSSSQSNHTQNTQSVFSLRWIQDNLSVAPAACFLLKESCSCFRAWKKYIVNGVALFNNICVRRFVSFVNSLQFAAGLTNWCDKIYNCVKSDLWLLNSLDKKMEEENNNRKPYKVRLKCVYWIVNKSLFLV